MYCWQNRFQKAKNWSFAQNWFWKAKRTMMIEGWRRTKHTKITSEETNVLFGFLAGLPNRGITSLVTTVCRKLSENNSEFQQDHKIHDAVEVASHWLLGFTLDYRISYYCFLAYFNICCQCNDTLYLFKIYM